MLLDNFSLESQQTVPNYSLYPYKYPDFHLWKILPQLFLRDPSATVELTEISLLTYLTYVKSNWPISNLRSESERKYPNRTRTIAGSLLCRPLQGRIQDSFRRGVRQRNGVTDRWRDETKFFFCRKLVVLESHRSSQGVWGGGRGVGAHPLHPPPRSSPAPPSYSKAKNRYGEPVCRLKTW